MVGLRAISRAQFSGTLPTGLTAKSNVVGRTAKCAAAAAVRVELLRTELYLSEDATSRSSALVAGGGLVLGATAVLVRSARHHPLLDVALDAARRPLQRLWAAAARSRAGRADCDSGHA